MVFQLSFGNVDAEGLKFLRRGESRIDSCESAKSANHESRADQQDEFSGPGSGTASMTKAI
jgi:hypothetical protein